MNINRTAWLDIENQQDNCHNGADCIPREKERGNKSLVLSTELITKGNLITIKRFECSVSSISPSQSAGGGGGRRFGLV